MPVIDNREFEIRNFCSKFSIHCLSFSFGKLRIFWQTEPTLLRMTLDTWVQPYLKESRSQNVTRVSVWLLLLWCTENPLCAFPDFWRRSYSFSYNQKFFAKIRCLKEETGGWDRNMEGGRKPQGARRGLNRSRDSGRCHRTRSHGAQVRAGAKTLDQSLPTDVDMTRRCSILSPPEFDWGGACEN